MIFSKSYCMKRYKVKQKVIKDDFINNLIASCFDLLRLLIETWDGVIDIF